MKNKKMRNRMISFLLVAGLLLTYVPTSLASFNDTELMVAEKGADVSTAMPPSMVDGQVWTDKSVTYGSLTDDNFQVSLSALGQNHTSTTPGGSTTANVVLVLDVSGSTTDNSKLSNMVSAANTAIDKILFRDGVATGNKVAVVTFSDGADVEVSLRNTAFSLSTENGGSSVFKISAGGGTNIQSGINEAYHVLNAAKTGGDTATPVMIVLSDGVACYYSTNYTGIPTVTNAYSSNSYPLSGWAEDGDGYLDTSNGTSSNYGITAAAYTIAQALYLKTRMNDLKIYTIGFGTGNHVLANATLNPTAANIALATGNGTPLSGVLNTVYPAATYFYPEGGGAFSGTGVDIATLTAQFNQILEDSLNNHSPLAAGSFVTFTDTIGAGFVVLGDITMALGENNYTFTDPENDGTYTCAADEMSGVSVAVSGGTLAWTLPASLLPCNSYTMVGGVQTLVPAVPTTLTFNVSLTSGALAGTYYTDYNSEAAYENSAASAGCHAQFTPAESNPYYYVSASSTTTENGTVGTYTNTAEVVGHWEETDSSTISGLDWKCKYSYNESDLNVQFLKVGSDQFERDATGVEITTVYVGIIGGWHRYDVSAVKTIDSGTNRIKTTLSVRLAPLSGQNNIDTDDDYGNTYATKTITSYTWIAAAAAVNNFTATPMPDIAGDAVSITAGGHPYAAAVTAYTSATSWTAEATEISGNTVTNYTLAVSGTAASTTLAIDYTATTVNPATPKPGAGVVVGLVTHALANTGWITLQKNISSLTIEKAVEAYDGTNFGDVSSFDFSVSLSDTTYSGTAVKYRSSDDTPTGATYAITNGTGSLSIGNGEYVTIPGLTIDTVYSVTEADYSAGDYAAAAAVISGNATVSGRTASGSILASGNKVKYTNTYYPTADISIRKDISRLYPDKVSIPNGITFPFELYKKNADDSYTKLPGFSASVTTAGGAAQYPATMKVRLDKIMDLIGSGNSVTLYIKEGAMSGGGMGWTADNSYFEVEISKNGTVQYCGRVESGDTLSSSCVLTAATFTNWYVPTSQLTLTKHISGGTVPEGGFDFTVTLGGSAVFGYGYTINRGSGTTETGSGDGPDSIDVSLGSDENIVMTGIPVGTPYTIAEAPYSAQGYYPTLNAGQSLTGFIVLTGSTVNVTNTYQTNDLIISKLVSASSNPADTFEFTVKINGSTYTGFQYVYSDDTADPKTVHTSADGKIMLKGGQSATLKGVPVGAVYVIEETGNAAYTTESGTDSNSLALGSSVTVNLTSADSSAVPTAYFKNTYKIGSLTVTKSVLVDPIPAAPMVMSLQEGHSDPVTYPVTVTFTGGYLGAITYAGNLDNDGDGIFYLNLPDNGAVTFINIPAGVTYIVEETDTKGADSVAYFNGSVTREDNATGAVTCDTTDTVTIYNNYLTPATLNITKKVLTTDDSPAATGAFEFEIYFYTEVEHPAVDEVYDNDNQVISEAKDAYTEKVGYNLADPGELPTGGTLTAVSGQDGKYTFTLSGDATLTFSSLPVGLKFEVSETANGGAKATNISVNNDSVPGGTVTGTIAQDASGTSPIGIVFTNDFRVTPGTLALTKTVSDRMNLSGGSYTFEAVFSGQTSGISFSGGENGVLTHEPVVGDGSITYQFTITTSGSTSVSFAGLQLGTQYQVTEFTAADSRVFTGAGTTGTNDAGNPTASGTMAAQSGGFVVQDVTISCTNTYNPPATTTEKTATKLVEGTPVDLSDENGAPVGGVNKNQPVTYTIKVTNIGDKTVTLNEVADGMFDRVLAQLPAGGTIQDVVAVTHSKDGAVTEFTVEAGGSGPPAVTAKLVLTNGCTLERQDFITIQYTVSFNAYGNKSNTATSYSYYEEHVVTSSDTVTITVYPDSGMEIEKQVADGGPVAESVNYSELIYSDAATADAALWLDYKDIAVYKVTVTNSNEADLSQINLHDPLFTAESIVSVKRNGDALVYLLDADSHIMTFPVIEGESFILAQDDVIEVIYWASANWISAETGNNYTNTATVSAHDGLNGLEEEDSANVTIMTPTIKVTKTSDAVTALTGESIGYTITIENTYGESLDLRRVSDTMFQTASEYALNAHSIVVTVAGTPLDSTAYSLDAGALCFAQTSGETTTYPVTFAAGEKVEIAYRVTFFTAGDYTNTADATATYRGLEAKDMAGNDPSVRVEIKDPKLGMTVDKRANGEKEITVYSGSTVTYTVKLTNSGDYALGEVYLQDPMFKNSTFAISSVEKTVGGTTTTLINGMDYIVSEDMISFISSEIVPTGVAEFATESDYDSWLYFESRAVITVTYTATLTATYENTVTAHAINRYENEIEDISSARVNVIYYYDPDPTPTPTPTPTPSEEPTPTITPTETPTPSPSTSPDQGVLGDSDEDDGEGVLGDSDKLPQTGGMSTATALAILGAMMAGAGAILTFKKKNDTGAE